MSAPYTKLAKPISDYALLCRGCLAESGEMKNMFEWGLSEDFMKFTDVQVNRSEMISQLICTDCEGTLTKCKMFRDQCRQSDMFLTTSIKETCESMGESSDFVASLDGVIDVKDAQETYENTISTILLENKLLVSITAPDMKSRIHMPCPYVTQFNCKEKFFKRKHLMAHLIKVHGVDENDFNIEINFYCAVDGCYYNSKAGKNRYFSERKFLNQHINKVHKAKDLCCENCDFKCSTKVEFERHLKTCSVIYKCDLCNVHYKKNERLLVHLMRKHPELHEQYKRDRKTRKRLTETCVETKKSRLDVSDYTCDSPKRSFATQTLDHIKNDVSLSWNLKNDSYETKTDEISTQTVFEDLLSLKSQTSEDDMYFPETVSLTDIQTQTFPIEFGLHRSNKQTITSETQSPDLSMKETQTCVCLYDSPRDNFKLFDSVSSSPSSLNLASTQTQTADVRPSIRSDVMLSFNSTETQTCFESSSESL